MTAERHPGRITFRPPPLAAALARLNDRDAARGQRNEWEMASWVAHSGFS
jgi:hypothetical protein